MLSPKSNQFFVMFQLYIHKNLVRTQPLVHKILCKISDKKKCHANTKANRICTKINMCNMGGKGEGGGGGGGGGGRHNCISFSIEG